MWADSMWDYTESGFTDSAAQINLWSFSAFIKKGCDTRARHSLTFPAVGIQYKEIEEQHFVSNRNHRQWFICSTWSRNKKFWLFNFLLSHALGISSTIKYHIPFSRTHRTTSLQTSVNVAYMNPQYGVRVIYMPVWQGYALYYKWNLHEKYAEEIAKVRKKQHHAYILLTNQIDVLQTGWTKTATEKNM